MYYLYSDNILQTSTTNIAYRFSYTTDTVNGNNIIKLNTYKKIYNS